ELQEIESSLPNDVNEKNRATQGLVLAMQSRVALYAASIAKYGALRTPSVILPGGEVGIPASMATKYYETSLAAAKKLIGMNTYALYMKESPTLEERYSKIFYDKSGNPEVIFAEDFKLKSGKTIPFTILNQPFAGTEEPGDAGRVNPTLNLVQSFEKLDNTFAPLTKTNANDLLVDENNELLVFDQPQDLFAGRDARLGGTIILPGTKFKGKEVDIWAGWMVPATNKIYDASAPGNQGVDPLPGKTVREQSIGGSGPVLSFFRAAQTGFYLRKYLDPTPGSGQRGSGSEVWWIRYRYAEVLLNAAEAAFELGQGADATDYINQVRRRAGFKTDLIPAEVTFNRIAHERKVELAFEGHELWDYKRWRIADIVWDGSRNDLTSMPGDIMQPSTRPFALWPFKVYDQADPDHKNQKWVFKRVLWDQLSGADRFALGNYYSEISNEVINRNPKIVRNPNQ
ncbi:MAG: RagB/SusD family nutrient uptake outer membrane protein, partial [Bacteroidota bacterium]